jgi:Secretion system C-terminal sorting domain
MLVFLLSVCFMAQRNSASAGIVTANNAITTVGDHDGNEKTLNGIYAAKTLKGLPLTWLERDQILAIAKQCPKKGGSAVYWARAWYAHLKGVEVKEEDCVIPRSKEAGGSQLTNSPDFRLFPNPAASQSFTIAGPAVPDGENWTISLYSGLGQLMGSYVYAKEGWTDLQLHTIPTGIYWCQVSDGKKKLSVQKISIIN